ncbi:MAG: sensor histidine kinase [Spirochaetia bacterium]
MGRGFTGVSETFDIGGTINLILYLHPETEVVGVISDVTQSDTANRAQLDTIKQDYSEHVFVDLIGLPAPELTAALKNLPEESNIIDEPDSFFYRYKTYLLEAGVVVSLLFIIITILIISTLHRKRITVQLRKTIKEKDFLMQELNHRVKNNLAAISSLINLKDSALGREADLSDIRSQIDAVQIVHELLYRSGEITHINIRRYIEDLLRKLFDSFTDRAITIENRAAEVRIPTKAAVSIGLIINELATNAIKYGFTDEAEARFTVAFTSVPVERNYILTVSNTGQPFPAEVDLNHPNTLGLRLVSALVQQLEGNVELQRTPNPFFIISIPAASVS